MPFKLPMRNDFALLLHWAHMGMEMMAPSGMFWMSMPSETQQRLLQLRRHVFLHKKDKSRTEHDA